MSNYELDNAKRILDKFRSMTVSAMEKYDRRPAEEFKAYMNGFIDFMNFAMMADDMDSNKPEQTTSNKPKYTPIREINPEVLYYEPISGQFIDISPVTLKRFILEFDRTIKEEGEATLNDWLNKLGLRQMDDGWLFVWHAWQGRFDISPRNQIIDGKMVVTMNYLHYPRTFNNKEYESFVEENEEDESDELDNIVKNDEEETEDGKSSEV